MRNGLRGFTRAMAGLAVAASFAAAGCTAPQDQACAEQVLQQKAMLLQQEAHIQDLKNQIVASERRVRDAEVDRNAALEKFATARTRLEQEVNRQPPPQFVSSRLPAKVQAQLEDLARRFNAEFHNDRLYLPSDLYFASGQYVLSAHAKTMLRQMAAMLRAENLTLQIVGHTDSDRIRNPALVNQGIRDNRMLSMRRAKSVLEELEAGGYPGQLMYATGWGDLRPIAQGASREAKARNRRVEILIDTSASTIFPMIEIQGVTPGADMVAQR